MPPAHYRFEAFPPDDRINWSTLIPKIGPAYMALAKFDQLLSDAPNSKLFLSHLQLNEAVHSSHIEGIYASSIDVMKFEGGHLPVSTVLLNNIQEILNCRDALNHAATSMHEESCRLSLDIIKSAHSDLMNSVRGRDKSPGKFRTCQNYIGPPGGTIHDMRYIPIAPENLEQSIRKWDDYQSAHVHDRLVESAIMHAEFEALHPFEDGNGRVGRLIIPLSMWQSGLIHEPVFFISQWLVAHHREYYDRLLAVSRDDDWTGWCSFFLDAVREQSIYLHSLIKRIQKLYHEIETRIEQLMRTRYDPQIMEAVFSCPVFNVGHFSDQTKIPSSTAHRLLATLCENGILQQMSAGSGRRPALYAFADLLGTLYETQRW